MRAVYVSDGCMALSNVFKHLCFCSAGNCFHHFFFKPVLWKIEDHNLSVCLEKKIILIEEYISNGGFYHIFKKCTDSRLHEEASFHVLVRVLRFFP